MISRSTADVVSLMSENFSPKLPEIFVCAFEDKVTAESEAKEHGYIVTTLGLRVGPEPQALKLKGLKKS